MTKKRLLLIAVLPLAFAVTVGALAMLPTGPGVTKANFDRIEVGMTKAEVQALFGKEPDIAQNYGYGSGIVTHCEGWAGHDAAGYDGAFAEVGFYPGGDIVACKGWQDSPETLFQKLRRWLHIP